MTRHLRGKGRTGFTVVELLVSIGIIGLLMAVLLPAVQSVRESSRRSTCRSHLKQVILASMQYESTFRIYPNIQWRSQLLPYVEGDEGKLLPPVYFCPSDPLVTRRFELNANFDINTGVGGLEGFSSEAAFVFRRPSDITDGTSNTAAFSERLVWPDWGGQQVASGSHSEVWPRRVLRTPHISNTLDEFADECEFHALPPAASWYVYFGYTHGLPPNRNSCVNGPGSDAGGFIVTTKSLHNGLVHTALADGSVRTTSDSIDRNVWRAIGTRQGNETIGEW